MAHRINDRWLWLGFGVFIFFAARSIRSAIKETVLLTEIDPAQYEDKDDKHVKQPEDGKNTQLEICIANELIITPAIDLATLKTLATSPNTNIANAAMSLIITRFARTPYASMILGQDSRSKDPSIRNQARTAIAFINDWPWPFHADRDAGFDLPWTPPRHHSADADDDGVELTLDSLPDLIHPTEVDEQFAEVRRPRAPHDDVETDRRRRRREAMVLHEGGGGIVEADIIRPR